MVDAPLCSHTVVVHGVTRHDDRERTAVIPASARVQLDAALDQMQVIRVLLHRHLTNPPETQTVTDNNDDLSYLDQLASATTDTLRDTVNVLDDIFDIDIAISVSPSATATAVTLITAYVDGLERDDGFELLSSTIVEALSSEETSARKMAELLSAMARVAANLSLERTRDTSETLGDIQVTAVRLGTQ